MENVAMEFKSERGRIIAELCMLKLKYIDPKNRTPGWDRKVQSRVMELMTEYHFGKHDPEVATIQFLDATINQLEVEDRIDELVSRRKHA